MKKISKKIILCFLISSLLNGCAISGLVNEKKLSWDVLDKETMQEKKEKANLDIQMSSPLENKMILFSVSPVIPIPPLLPVFLIPIRENERLCGKDRQLSIIIRYISDKEENDELLIDIDKIYLIGKNNETIKPYRYRNSKPYPEHISSVSEKNPKTPALVKSGRTIYSSSISFSVKCSKELDNYKVVINGLSYSSGEKIPEMVKVISYNSNYKFKFTYLMAP